MREDVGSKLPITKQREMVWMKQTNTASHTHTTVGGGSNFRVFSCYSPWHWWQISTTSPRFTANPWGTSPLKRQMAAETHKTTGVSIRNNVSIKGGPSNNTHTQPPYSWAAIPVCSFKTLGEMRNLCKTLHRRPCETSIDQGKIPCTAVC